MATAENLSAVAKKYVRIFNAATKDSDRMAALIILGKVLKKENCTMKAGILGDMDLNFFVRMLKSESTMKDQDGTEVPLRSVAMTILQQWAVDPELMLRPDFLRLLHSFGDIIISTGQSVQPELQSTVRDVYNCLVSMIGTVEGRVSLLENEVVPSLCQAVVRNCLYNETAVEILVYLSQRHEAVLWEHNPSEMAAVVQDLAAKTHTSQEAFGNFEILVQLLRGIDSAFKAPPDWLQDVVDVLFNALKSKISPEDRRVCLRLACELVHAFELRWVASPQDLFLLTQLAALEVGVTAEYSIIFGHACEAAPHLVACFTVLEAAVRWLSASEDACAAPDFMARLVGRLDEAFASLARLLDRLVRDENAISSAASDRQSALFLTAAVRVLGLWLSQEDWERALSLLPEKLEATLKTLGTISLSFGEEPKALVRFLLPALCRLSSTAEHRQILLASGWPELVVCFGLRCLENPAEDLVTSLCAVINVLLNFLLEKVWLPELTPMLEAVIAKWQQLIALNDLFFSLHLALLLAAVLPVQPKALSDRARLFVLEIALNIFERLPPAKFRRTLAARRQWEEVQGLWLLIIQLFTDFSESSPSCIELVERSGDAQTVNNILEGLDSQDPTFAPLRTFKAVISKA